MLIAPCPGYIIVFPLRVSKAFIDAIISSSLPVGKSVLPYRRLKSVSPVNTASLINMLILPFV